MPGVNEPWGSFPYVILDARYEKVRHGGRVIDCAVLIALGVDTAGKRQVLGCSVSLSEAEPHWREFLSSLKDRGLHGIVFIVSDAHEGLKAARKAVFPSVPLAALPVSSAAECTALCAQAIAEERKWLRIFRAIFNAQDESEAKRLLDHFIQRYHAAAPKLASWAETALPEGFAVFDLPDQHRKRLRTTNVLERVNKEIKRRTRVATLFPNETSCLRLVTAVVMEISDEWRLDEFI